jgi:hypothetical protein
MVDVADLKKNIQVESVQYRSSISESTGFALAGSINFINNRQYDTHQFNFNGRYSLGVSVLGADGVFPILFNMEIVGFSMFTRKSGTSGTTEIDLQWFDGANSNQGSIFTTKPSIDSTSSDNSYLIKNILTNTDVILPTGATSPVFSKTEFDAGDAVLCRIDSAMSDAEGLHVLVHFRPR